MDFYRLKSISTIVVIIVLILLFSEKSFAQTFAGERIFTSSNSPRVIAMGECAVNNISEQSVYDNPGTLGILHLDKLIAMSIPFSTDYLAGMSLTSERTTLTASIGGNYRRIFGKYDKKLNVSLAFAYSKDKQINKFAPYTFNPFGHTFFVDTYRRDTYNIYSFSLGIHYYFRFGFGMSFKSHDYLLQNDSYYGGGDYKASHDIGFYFDCPLFLLNKNSKRSGDKKALNLTFNPSVAFVKQNIGGNYFVKDASDKYWGIGITASLRAENRNYFSFKIFYESDKPANEVIFYEYSGPGSWGIDFYTVEYTWRNKIGYELGLLDLGLLRFGKIDGVDRVSYGYGLSARGIMNFFFNEKDSGKSCCWLRFLLDNFDIQYEYAAAANLVDQIISYHKLSLSL
jgi:hypothetical protein